MQHNWWIAAFEAAGIWTREQAEHVSDSIKIGIHREKYPEAFNDLKDILSKGAFGVGSITNVESEITALKAQIKLLVEQVATKVEAEVPVVKETIAKATKST